MSNKAKFRIFLLLVLAGLGVFVVVLIFKERDPVSPFKEAERLYSQEGKILEDQGLYREAAAKYDQAHVLLENTYKRLNGRNRLDAEQAKEIAGRVLYLKAKVLRDKHYALAAASGKPLPEVTDSVTGEKFRSVLAIPSREDLEEAAGSLRGAALHFLPKDLQAQLDALRLTLMATPVLWDQVERYSRAILDIKNDDSRAKYLLAKYDFEQPERATNSPAPVNRRSLERVRNASQVIDQVSADSKFPVWRTEYLRARIHSWLMKHYAATAQKDYLSELDTLNRLLFDNRNGALARIRAGERMDLLSADDIEGILGLYAIATEVAIAEARRAKGDVSLLVRVYDEALAFCESKFHADDPNFPRPLVIGTLIEMMNSGQKTLAVQISKQWKSGLKLLRPVLEDELRKGRCDPYRIAQFSELLMRESQIEARRNGDPQLIAESKADAKKWLDDAMKFGKERGSTAAQMTPFYLLSANMCFFNFDSRDVAAPFLTALKESLSPYATLTALLIDAAYDEREGRLEKARKKAEQAIQIAGGDDDVRVHALLVNIYMALGLPEQAEASIARLKRIYARHTESTFTDLEKDWLSAFLPSPQDFYALSVVVHLESARRSIANYFSANPNASSFPVELVEKSEAKAKSLLDDELSSLWTKHGFFARTRWIHHLTLTKRLKLAEQELQKLSPDFSDRVELLELKIGIMKRAALDSRDERKLGSIPGEVDSEIQAFIKAHPNNPSARLLFAIWLAESKRNEQAVATLKEAAETFGNSPGLRRATAAILLSLDADASPSPLSRHLPRDPQIDRTLFDLALSDNTSAGPGGRDSLFRHESTGLARIQSAQKFDLDGDFVKAVDLFASSLDYTRVRALAERGLFRSMVSLANKDSEAALATIRRIATELPNEPVVFLSYAYVCLVRDEIGHPDDFWGEHHTMAGALHAWEFRMEQSGRGSPVALALTRAEFWFLAHRIDIALVLAKRAIHHNRQDPNLLVVCVGMMLDDPSRDPHPELVDYIEGLKRSAPEGIATQQLAARAAESRREWKQAMEIYERILAKSPKDRQTYSRLIAVLDQKGDFSRGLNWAKEWRAQLPNDSVAAAAEVRMLVRAKEIQAARTVAEGFLQHAQTVAAKLSDSIKNPEEKAKFLEDSRWLPAIEMARGFYFGGAEAEAEARLLQVPSQYLGLRTTQELLAEVLLKRGDWTKAEAILETLVHQSPRNILLVNNLAYVLAHHVNKPDRARDVILAALQTNSGSTKRRSADRLPPEFLATIGTVYAKLGNPAYGREMLEMFQAASPRYLNDPRVELYLGYALELLGEETKARNHYENAEAKSSHPGLSPDQHEMTLRDTRAFLERLNGRQKR